MVRGGVNIDRKGTDRKKGANIAENENDHMFHICCPLCQMKPGRKKMKMKQIRVHSQTYKPNVVLIFIDCGIYPLYSFSLW